MKDTAAQEKRLAELQREYGETWQRLATLQAEIESISQQLHAAAHQDLYAQMFAIRQSEDFEDQRKRQKHSAHVARGWEAHRAREQAQLAANEAIEREVFQMTGRRFHA